MFSDDNYLALKLKNLIESRFPYADIKISFNKDFGEYFISTRNKELYYSEDYLMLLFEIDNDILWEQGKFNFFFTLNQRGPEYDFMANSIIFSVKESGHYPELEAVKPSGFAGNNTVTDNLHLAA